MTLESEYNVVIHPNPLADGGGFIAVVPDLPGCMSDGKTGEAAATDATNATREWIEEAKRLNRAVPTPTRRIV